VGHDGGDGASLAVGWFCLPGFRRKIANQVVIDAVIGAEGSKQSFRQSIQVRFVGDTRFEGRIFRH
jgi:hypothetical protein